MDAGEHREAQQEQEGGGMKDIGIDVDQIVNVASQRNQDLV